MADTDTTLEAPATEAPDTTPPTSVDELGTAGKAALDAERRRARDAERTAKELAAKVAAFEEQGKSEVEKAIARAEAAEKRADELAARLNDTAKADALRSAATTLGAIDVDVVTALLASKVDIDDDGNPVGADEAVRALQASKPHLFDSRPAGYGDGIPKSGSKTRTAADLFAAQTRDL